MGYGEAKLGDHSGDDDRDWNSGDETSSGAPKGICRETRRCKASFWADNSKYFCIDSFLHKAGRDMGAIVGELLDILVLRGWRVLNRGLWEAKGQRLFLYEVWDASGERGTVD